MIIGNEVWFKPVRADQDVLRVRIGQEKDGVKVVSTEPPWTVKVSYDGFEFDVTVFQQGETDKHFGNGTGASGSSLPGIVDAEPGTPPPDEPDATQPDDDREAKSEDEKDEQKDKASEKVAGAGT